MTNPLLLAVDLGATSGRVIAGSLDRGSLTLRHMARFANEPVRLADGLHWDMLHLYHQVIRGLAHTVESTPGAVASVGIDSWAVDYGLIRAGALLGVPYHYRDERTSLGVEAVHKVLGADELYRRNGLQHLPFNTLYQIAVDRDRGLLDLADQILLVPDLLTYWLTGTIAAERTNASTTGMLHASTGQWDRALTDPLRIPARILPELVDPGWSAGTLTAPVAQIIGESLRVTAVGSHDTASAVVAVPSTDRDVAYISCGTWGLVGLELDAPVLTEEARIGGFTNERGVDDRIRFLHNVMGLWILTETIRTWHPLATAEQRSSVLQELLADAERVAAPRQVFDVDDPRFLPPGDMPSRIASWYQEHDIAPPRSRAEFVRAIVESLAQAFASAVDQAATLAGRKVAAIHIVGGGSQNSLLCSLTVRRSGRVVWAGPIEATAIGNILVQARTEGLLDGGLETLREVVAAAFPPLRYDP